MGMNYLDAFNSVINQYGLTVLNDNFLVRSLLSDLVGNSYNDVQLIDAFNILNKDYSVYLEINNLSLEAAKKHIKEKISKSDKTLSIEQYIHSVEPLLMILYPNEYKPFKSGGAKVGVKKVKVLGKTKAKETPVIAQKPQLVNKKPAKSPKVNKPNQVNQNIIRPVQYLEIKTACSRLNVVTANVPDVQLLDTNNKKIILPMKMYRYNAYLFIEIPSTSLEYTVCIPKRHLYSLNVRFDGNFLKVEGMNNTKLSATRVEVTAKNAIANLLVSTSSLVCSQNSGFFYASGKINNTYIMTEDADIHIVTHSLTGNYYTIKTKEGNVDLVFTGSKVTPRINHIFKKVRNVDGDYYLGSHLIRLNLTTSTGKIMVN